MRSVVNNTEKADDLVRMYPDGGQSGHYFQNN